MNKKDLTSPCGLDCFNCPIYIDNITAEVKEKEVPCKGCLEQKGHFPWGSNCETYECVIGKGLRFCFECEEFPCPKLQPASEGANFFPHNMKVYNLCRMRLIGVEKWAEEESLKIREKYYKGKFKVGSGPIME